MTTREIGHKEAIVSRAVGLLNHALRLEYAAVIHLERLAVAVQDALLRRRLSTLSAESIGHAARTAAAIRELGGAPLWTMWMPSDGGTMFQLMEAQLSRESLCRGLYHQAARLLGGSPLAERCARLAEDEDQHMALVAQLLEEMSSPAARAS